MRSPATDLYLSFEYCKPDVMGPAAQFYSEKVEPRIYLVARPERPDGSNLNWYVFLRGQDGKMNGEVDQRDSVTLRINQITGSDSLILTLSGELLLAKKNAGGAAEKPFKLMYQDKESK